MKHDIEEIRNSWLKKEGEKMEEKRKYSHFDPIVKLDQKRTENVFNPVYVAGYSFSPLIKSVQEERRRKLKEVSGKREVKKKERPICFASHLDAVVYSWYGYYLNQLYSSYLEEKGLSDSILAYRALNRSIPEFVREVADFIRKQDDVTALCFDVTSFFDEIQHSTLKNKLIDVINFFTKEEDRRLQDDFFNIFQNVTRFKFIIKKDIERFFKNKRIPSRNGRYMPNGSFLEFVLDLHKTSKRVEKKDVVHTNQKHYGIPQGLPISGVLANLSMLDFDSDMREFALKNNGIYRRYSDDVLLVVNSNAAETANAKVISGLVKLGLRVSEGKTDIKIFSRDEKGVLICKNANGNLSHFQYLGIEFDGNFFYLRSQSIARFYRKLKRSIRTSVHALKKKGGTILRHRDFYKRFTTFKNDFEDENFLTYAERAHALLKPFSKINKQVNGSTIRRLIKNEINLRMKGGSHSISPFIATVSDKTKHPTF